MSGQQVDLVRLSEADREIRRIVGELGLEPEEQEFDVVPAAKMLEIMAYRLPVNYSHWSFGRDYEIERTRYEYGFAVPYEVVFNSRPSRAYLMETNPFAIQALVMAHVYAHNDFMARNRHFAPVRRDMLGAAGEAAGRFRRYEERFGAEAVERTLDAALSIEWHTAAPGEGYRERRARERPPRPWWEPEGAAGAESGGAAAGGSGGAYEDLLGRFGPEARGGQAGKRRVPAEPSEDLTGFILAHSPAGLAPWQEDILEVVRAQAQYFQPNRRTKIMNEGWATFWHERVMGRLFAEGLLGPEEHGLYNLYNARVKAHNARAVNPYLLGSAVFERLWAEESREAGERAALERLREVRGSYMDWFFLEQYLSREIAEELGLYRYAERDGGGYVEQVVEETEWQAVKRELVRSLTTSGVPRITVVDGDYEGSLQLYLRHEWDGLALEEEYAKRTLAHIHYLWGRPVYLETRDVKNRKEHTKIIIVDKNGIRTMYPEDMTYDQ